MNRKKDQDLKGYNAMSAGLAFITVSIFLIFAKDNFFNTSITKVAAILFTGLGAGVFSAGLQKYTHANTTYIGAGAVLLSIWGALYFYINHWLLNIIGLIFMFIGAGGVFLGLFDFLDKNLKGKNAVESLKSIVLFLTSIGSLILIILQIVNFK